jgi:transcriptional regulator with XRE-family HTH domain
MARASVEEWSSRLHKQTPRYRRTAKALGLQVRALRQAKGWTLEEAAEKGDLDLKHWQKIEAGTINVTLVTLVRIAEGLGETLGSLFGTPVAPTKRRTRGLKSIGI